MRDLLRTATSNNAYLQTSGTQFVTRDGDPVKLHGIGLGGWLNLENYILGFPGTEALVRRALTEVLGDALAEHFFERFTEVFFTDADAAEMARIGFNVVRIPVHYRRLEDDAAPFRLKESGFAALDRAIDSCSRHGLYALIDLHVIPGSQNGFWHSDNATHHAGFWGHPHFEERVLNIWRAIAARYRSNPWVAGYEPLQEPGDPTYRHICPFCPMLLDAIREVDPDHILFLKGNEFGSEWEFYTETRPNTVFIAFDFAVPGTVVGGPYPGESDGIYYDRSVLEQRFLQITEQARNTNTPIWVVEFGPIYTNDEEFNKNRYRVLRDQLDIYHEHDANWSLWNWKDIGVHGVVELTPDSPYLRRIAPAQAKKARLATDAWGDEREIRDVIDPLTTLVRREFPDHPNPDGWVNRLVRQILLGEPLVREYAECFRGLTASEIDEVMNSFAVENCLPREPLVELVHSAIAADMPAARAQR